MSGPDPQFVKEQWVEVSALGCVVLGILLAIILRNATFSYFVSILSGAIAGRLFFIKHYSQPIFPTIFIITGFLLGYLVANFWASRVLILLLFLAAAYGSYYLHKEKIITIFKSNSFVK